MSAEIEYALSSGKRRQPYRTGGSTTHRRNGSDRARERPPDPVRPFYALMVSIRRMGVFERAALCVIFVGADSRHRDFT
jgi:hypothetical protein